EFGASSKTTWASSVRLQEVIATFRILASNLGVPGQQDRCVPRSGIFRVSHLHVILSGSGPRNLRLDRESDLETPRDHFVTWTTVAETLFGSQFRRHHPPSCCARPTGSSMTGGSSGSGGNQALKPP